MTGKSFLHLCNIPYANKFIAPVSFYEM